MVNGQWLMVNDLKLYNLLILKTSPYPPQGGNSWILNYYAGIQYF